jgi:hypothetical protein
LESVEAKADRLKPVVLTLRWKIKKLNSGKSNGAVNDQPHESGSAAVLERR